MVEPFRTTSPGDDAQHPFRDVAHRVRRAETWEALTHVLRDFGAARVQIVARVPDGLELVADTRGPVRAEASVPDRPQVARCFDEDQCLRTDDGRVAYLPCVERDQVAAVARVERAADASDAAWRELPALAWAFSGALTQRFYALQARLVGELTHGLAADLDPEAGALRALKTLVPLVNATAGILLVPRRGRLWPLADYGAQAEARRPQLAEGLAAPEGVAWEAFRSGQPQFARDYPSARRAIPDLAIDPVVLHVPLLRGGVARRVLTLSFAPGQAPTEGDVAMVAAAADAMSALLDGLREGQFQERLFGLIGTASRPDADVEAVRREVLRIAVDSVPGAQTGSLAVRDGADGFRVVHVEGGAGAEEAAEALPEASWRALCGTSLDSWRSGRARVLRRSETDLTARARGLGRPWHPDEAGEALAPKANLCLPLVRDGRVWAVLDLDNAVHEEAFGADSVQVANQVGVAASLLGRMIEDRERAQELAHTDSLTAVANRRGGEVALDRALRRARRYQEPLSLLVLDLGGFKDLNDALGHATGDAALRAVADVLRHEVRDADAVTRWGGDEFLLALPRQDAAGAYAAAERLVATVGALDFEGQALAVHVGVAAFPEDGATVEALLHEADVRMYEAKREHAAGGVKAAG